MFAFQGFTVKNKKIGRSEMKIYNITNLSQDVCLYSCSEQCPLNSCVHDTVYAFLFPGLYILLLNRSLLYKLLSLSHSADVRLKNSPVLCLYKSYAWNAHTPGDVSETKTEKLVKQRRSR